MGDFLRVYLRIPAARILLARFFLALSILKCAVLYAQSEYSVQNLGDETSPYALNNSGVVVGTFLSSPIRAFSYSNGIFTDLGTLGGTRSVAYGINDGGTIVGDADLTNGFYHACMWSNGVISDLGTLGGPTSMAFGINNAGTIVGVSDLANDKSHAFIWSNGTMTDLGTLPGDGWSMAMAINSSGVIVGESNPYGYTDSYARAFSYSNGVMTDLGWSGYASHAYGINDAGSIVGKGVKPGFGYRGFVTIGGVINELDSLLTASGINHNGTIVGSGGAGSYPHPSRYGSGFFRDLYSYVTNIGIAGNNHSYAVAVNDTGTIVGYGYTSAQQVRGFILTRIPPTIILGPPVVSNATVRVSFTVTSGSAESFTLMEADCPTGPWNASSNAVLSVDVPGGSYNFVVPLVNSTSDFYRIRAP